MKSCHIYTDILANPDPWGGNAHPVSTQILCKKRFMGNLNAVEKYKKLAGLKICQTPDYFGYVEA